MIVDIKSIINEKEKELTKRLDILREKGIMPKVVFIVANDDEASKVYLKNKSKVCDRMGILQEEIYFKKGCSNEEIINCIKKLNKDNTVTAILLQLPIYKSLDVNSIINSIEPKKDVDGFTALNVGNLYLNESGIIPCTPKGIMYVLDNLNIEMEGKHTVVIGRSNIVGRPIAQLLLNRNCTVTICHRKTKELYKYTKEADILVVAAGSPKLITKNMVKRHSVIIDVGINRIDGNVVGDVDTKNVSNKVKYVTPVPGGIGPMTIMSLIENIITICEKNI